MPVPTSAASSTPVAPGSCGSWSTMPMCSRSRRECREAGLWHSLPCSSVWRSVLWWARSGTPGGRGRRPLPDLTRPALLADVPDDRSQDGEHEEGEEEPTGHGQEPPGCPPRPDGDDLHHDGADDGASQKAVHE